MYRWGYYLGPSAMTETEFNTALSALYSQAIYQRDPQAQAVFQSISQRRWGKSQTKQSFYPVRAQLNRSIIATDPTRSSRKGSAIRTLFSALDILESAILQGQAVEIRRTTNPYQQQQVGTEKIWPLQLIHYDIAWYIAYERIDDHHLVVGRLDRFDDSCKKLDGITRSQQQQQQRLQDLHQLLENGWGLLLGDVEEQSLELRQKLALTQITVRFYKPTVDFIREGVYRHPTQKLIQPPKGRDYIDYQVQLPPRSHDEFLRWVNRFMGNAKILSPPELAEKHRILAQQQCQRYETD